MVGLALLWGYLLLVVDVISLGVGVCLCIWFCSLLLLCVCVVVFLVFVGWFGDCVCCDLDAFLVLIW